MPDILSFRSSAVVRLRQLLNERKAREQEGAFVLEGIVAIRDAIASGAIIQELFVSKASQSHFTDMGDAEIRLVEDDVFERLGGTVTPQPAIAIARQIDVPLAQLQNATGVAVAIDVNDPGNVGSLIRSAAAAGFDGVVLSGETADVYNPKVVRATSAALFQVPFVKEKDASLVLKQLHEWGIATIATTGDAGKELWSADLSGRVAIVIGNEARGLGDHANLCDSSVAIPMANGVESLNAATAGAVCFFEVARQRNSAPSGGQSV